MLGIGHRGHTRFRSKEMEKIEAMAFTVGFVLTGFLSLAALPLA